MAKKKKPTGRKKAKTRRSAPTGSTPTQSQSSYSSGEILKQLDEGAAGYQFPMLDNGYVYPAAARLEAFRDPARWAIAIEVLGYNPRAGSPHGLQVAIACFGNCLDGEPGLTNRDFHQPIEDGPTAPLAGQDDESGEDLNVAARDVLIRGKVVRVSHDPRHYTKRGVDLEDPPRVRLFEFLRGLLPEHRAGLLGTEREIRTRIPTDLPAFLVLDDWLHPDVAGDELPSECPTFQRLAEALVAGDPAVYKPPRKPNTHWSNWPEGGTL